MGDFRELLELCRGRHIYIQTHNFPDPDAIGSAFGLQKLLALWEIPSTICYDKDLDKISATRMLHTFHIEMLPYEALRSRMREEDFIICVDSQKNNGKMTDLAGNEVACVDHHPIVVKPDYRYQDIRTVGACCTLIAQYYRQMGKEPDRDAATAMLYGLKMDTLQFTRGVTEEDIAVFLYLFPLCDQEALLRMERNNLEFSDLKAYGAAIESIELYEDVGISELSFACPDALVAMVADFILALQEVEVAVVFSHQGDGIKFSVRSENPRIHAGELVRHALDGYGSGGGHAEMAGGFIRAEQTPLLGDDPKSAVRELFLGAMSRKEPEE